MDRPRTKQVCTIGPASGEKIAELVIAGMDVARVNFSHGTADDHRAYVHGVRSAAHSARRSVAVLVDLPGPKLRLGELEGGEARLATGAQFMLRTRVSEPAPAPMAQAVEEISGPAQAEVAAESEATPPVEGEAAPESATDSGPSAAAQTDEPDTTVEIQTSVASVGDSTGADVRGSDLSAQLQVGDRVLMADGAVELTVSAIEPGLVTTEVVNGGLIRSRSGVNIPSERFTGEGLTDADRAGVARALELRVDLIAQSFVGSAADVHALRALLPADGPRLIAKIETDAAVKDFEAICAAADGIMVARGDLGVELPLEEVPLVQKRAIELCRAVAKPVIVATQVLESMISSPVPTRAETSDCANAVLDGTDAVMLSGETSVGEYPIITVETMARIISNTEEKGYGRIAPYLTTPRTRGGAVTHAAAEIAEVLDIKYIVTFTQSGDSAMRMSRLRPHTPMMAFTPDAGTQKRLALSWGVHARLVKKVESTDEMVNLVDSYLKDSERAVDGDLVIVVSGTPVGVPGTTNSIFVHKVGQIRA